jgi:hypothetical protein
MLAEFDEPEQLVAAVQKAKREGYDRVDAYSPFPVEGLHEAMGLKRTKLGWIVLSGGIFGAIGGFGMQYYAQVISYPVIYGGRPIFSWPAYIPVTFETTILCAALSAVLGMLALNGLPQPYHPLFNEPRFEKASQTHFFICIRAKDPMYDVARTKAFMKSLNPSGVYEIED